MSITGGIMAGVGLAGAAMSSNAAGNAASEQAAAANNAAQLQYKASQNALGFQQQQYNTSQQELQPFLQSGTAATSNLDYLMGINPQGASQGPSASPSPYGSLTGPPGTVANPATSGAVNGLRPLTGSSAASPQVPGSTLSAGTPAPSTFSASPSSASPGGYGSLLTPYSGSFSAPTALTEQNDPGYQARLQLGQQALQQSAAARGNLLTGGTAQALNQNAQDYASNEYNNVYNRALSTYGTNYNQYENQQAGEFNKLSALAGGGQTAANTLGSLGQNASNNVSSNLLSTANAMGQQGNNAAAANASGIVGSANAWSNGLSGASSNLGQLALLQQLQGGGAGAAPSTNYNELTGAGF